MHAVIIGTVGRNFNGNQGSIMTRLATRRGFECMGQSFDFKAAAKQREQTRQKYDSTLACQNYIGLTPHFRKMPENDDRK